MCSRLDKLEREVAYWKGRESTEGIIGRQAQEIAELKAIIGDLRTDLKICRKPDGEVLLRPSHLAQSFINEPRVLSSHPPVIKEIEEHRRHKGCDSE